MTTTLSPAEMRNVAAESRDLDAALRARIHGEVRFDGWSRSLYSTDASLYQIQPVGVVIPRDSDDLHAALEVAAAHGVPLLARGAGSSLAGQAVGAALVLDTSKYLNSILAIDVEARTAVVEPGVTVAVLNRALAPLGLMLGPDPASAERATVGGSMANNATGSHSILYGMMADHILATDVLLADGSVARFGPEAPAELPTLSRRGGLEGVIYRDLCALARAATPAILARWPRHWRRASGYNLDRLAAALVPADQRAQFDGASRFRPAICSPERRDTINLAQFLAGSEGTLAIFKTITLNLVPRPQCTAVAVIHFNDLIAACAAITDVLETEPSACELLDRQLLDLARLQPEWARRLHFVEGDPAAVLLTEFYGASAAELAAHMERLAAQMALRGYHGAIVRVMDSLGQADLWAVRKAGLNLLMSRRGDFKPVPGIEDVSVPPEQLAAYIGRVLQWCAVRPGVNGVAVYAHASAGCLHVRPVVNVKTAQGVATLQAMADFAVELCIEYGGALSGEHGDGLSRSALNPRLFGPELYGALQQVKQIFDPTESAQSGQGGQRAAPHRQPAHGRWSTQRCPSPRSLTGAQTAVSRRRSKCATARASAARWRQASCVHPTWRRATRRTQPAPAPTGCATHLPGASPMRNSSPTAWRTSWTCVSAARRAAASARRPWTWRASKRSSLSTTTMRTGCPSSTGSWACCRR